MNEDDVRALLTRAEEDTASAQRREALCRSLATAFRETGELLWVGGNLLGPDRVTKTSPFGFGHDGAVGLATVIQIAGELTAGAAALLERANLYAAAALVRQLVEIEYLAWAFAEDHEQAEGWLRSTREERLQLWQPRDLRRRSQGRFRSSDYASHCERGGHPTPEATRLLPDHSQRDSVIWWWLDLALHGVSTWEYGTVAAREFGWSEHVVPVADRHGLTGAIEEWRRSEPLLALVAH